MLDANGRIVLYGLSHINTIFDNIIRNLNVNTHAFEIKLILSEAINNAFIHGNNSDADKPISIDWEIINKLLRISVSDCGEGVKNKENFKNIEEKNILDEGGRGLYIISCYTDEMEFQGNSLIMKKNLL